MILFMTNAKSSSGRVVLEMETDFSIKAAATLHVLASMVSANHLSLV